MSAVKIAINAPKYKCSRLYTWSTHPKVMVHGFRAAPHIEIVAPVLFLKTLILRLKSSSERLRNESIHQLEALNNDYQR